VSAAAYPAPGATSTSNALRLSASLDEWIAARSLTTPATVEADAMHALLVLRADQIEGCTEGSPEEVEFKAIADALEAYEAKRWPDGKAPGGKG
jgi:hypothetical protein